MNDPSPALDDKDEPPVASGESGGSINRKQVLSGSSSLGDALLGKELSDRYVVTQLLGTGAMGVVYKARHKLLDREVAIKVLKQDASGDEVNRKRFETEAKAASALNHPNLIAVHDYGFMDDGTPFLVMDYLEGESLSSALKREKRLDPLRMITILKQVCTGLEYAHKKGLVHRDLKPNNVMLLPYANGRDLVKVVDFGIVKPIGADQELTATGQIFGTPFYMSPEQCQGRKLDGRSDIYSLGCLFYRMVAGKPPFTGENAVATIVMHVKDPPPEFAPEMLDSELLRALDPVIRKMLAKDPDDRYQSCDELRGALENVEHEHNTEKMNALLAESQQGKAVSVQAEQPKQPDEPPNKLLTPKILIATTLGCIVIAMIIVAIVGASMFEKPTAQQAPATTPPVTSSSPPTPASAPPAVTDKPISGISETGTAAVAGSAAPVDPATQDQGSADTAPAKPARTQVHHHHASAPAKPRGVKGFFKKLINAL
jgi:serine/threonine-protein kinase